ncbi:MAG TPA: carbon-nitrogen hydrolase family protein [Fimbriimonadaceae bacterium]|nr:carbon-nitrogen hydrolase family protein [Fimbriimonadaceae bacterium]
MTVKTACVQCDVAFGDPGANIERAVREISALGAQGVRLAVFPEAFLTGYVVDDMEAAAKIALPMVSHGSEVREHPAEDIVEACKKHKVHAVVGLISSENDNVYNTALLIEPNGRVRRYNKTHLPFLGVDRFVTQGDEISVFETEIGVIGVAICWDLRIPEVIRVLALQGAEIVALPTNWPEGSEPSPGFVAPTRAIENRVFVATANRIGTENGTTFIGQSGIYDVFGNTMAKAGAGEETIVAEIDPAMARQKRNVLRPGEYELAIFGSRRPELYGTITQE